MSKKKTAIIGKMFDLSKEILLSELIEELEQMGIHKEELLFDPGSKQQERDALMGMIENEDVAPEFVQTLLAPYKFQALTMIFGERCISEVEHNMSIDEPDNILQFPGHSKKSSDKSYEIKVSLKGAKPPIWRRLRVASDTPLDELHEIIQMSMGWFDCHLHAFRKGKQTFSTDSPDFGIPLFGVRNDNEEDFTLENLLRKVKEKCIYEYDFGDGWEHEILLEKIINEPLEYPVCVKALRACPPEDCGGIHSYNFHRTLLEDKQSPEHGNALGWAEHFGLVDEKGNVLPIELDKEDLEEINLALKEL